MAIALSQVTSFFDSTDDTDFGSNHTPLSTPSFITVHIQNKAGVGVDSVTYGGVAMAVAVDSGGATSRVQIWTLEGPADGEQTVAIVMSANTTTKSGAIMSWTGGGFAGASSSSTGTGGANTSSPAFVSATDSFCVDSAQLAVNGLTVNSGQTQRYSISSDAKGSTEPGAAPTVTMGWSSLGTFAWAHAALSIDVAGPTLHSASVPAGVGGGGVSSPFTGTFTTPYTFMKTGIELASIYSNVRIA